MNAFRVIFVGTATYVQLYVDFEPFDPLGPLENVGNSTGKLRNTVLKTNLGVIKL